MLRNTKLDFESDIDIIHETISQLEKIFTQLSKDDDVKYRHIINHLQAYKHNFFVLLRTHDSPTVQQLDDFEKELYSGIFNPQSTENKNKKNLRRSANIENAKTTFDTCDVIWSTEPPTSSTWRNILNKAQSNAAYVRSPHKLFYLNKTTQTFTEIPLSGYNRVFMLPTRSNQINPGEIGIVKTNWYNKLIISDNFFFDIHSIIGNRCHLTLVDDQPKTITDIKQNHITVYKDKLDLIDIFINKQANYIFSWVENGEIKSKSLSLTKVKPVIDKLEKNEALTDQEIQEILLKCDVNMHRTIAIIPCSDPSKIISNELQTYKAYWYEDNQLTTKSLAHNELVNIINLETNNVITDPKIIEDVISKCQCTGNNDIFTGYWKQNDKTEVVTYLPLTRTAMEDIPSLLPNVNKSLFNNTHANDMLIERISSVFRCSQNEEKLNEFDEIVKLNKSENNISKIALTEYDLKKITTISGHFHTNKVIDEKISTVITPHLLKINNHYSTDILDEIWPIIKEAREKKHFPISKTLHNSYSIRTHFESTTDLTTTPITMLPQIPDLQLDWKNNPLNEEQNSFDRYEDLITKKIEYYKAKVSELGNNEILLKTVNHLESTVRNWDSLRQKLFLNKYNLINNEPSLTKNNYATLIKETSARLNKKYFFKEYNTSLTADRPKKDENTIHINPPYTSKNNKKIPPKVYYYQPFKKAFESKQLTPAEYEQSSKIIFNPRKDLDQKGRDMAFLCGISFEHELYQDVSKLINHYQEKLNDGIKELETRKECLLKKAGITDQINNVWNPVKQSIMDTIHVLREKSNEAFNKVNEYNGISEHLQQLNANELNIDLKSKNGKLAFSDHNAELDKLENNLSIDFKDFEDLVNEMIRDKPYPPTKDILNKVEAIYFQKINQLNISSNVELSRLNQLISSYLLRISNELDDIQADKSKVLSFLFNQFKQAKSALINQHRGIIDNVSLIENTITIYKDEIQLAEKLWPSTFHNVLNNLQLKIKITRNDLDSANQLLVDQNLNLVTIDNINRQSIDPINKISKTLQEDIDSTIKLKNQMLDNYNGYKQTLKNAVYRENAEIRKNISYLIDYSIEYWEFNFLNVLDNIPVIHPIINKYISDNHNIHDQLKKFDKTEQTIQSIQEFQESISSQLNSLQDKFIMFNRTHIHSIISLYKKKLESLEKILIDSMAIAKSHDLIMKLPIVNLYQIQNLFLQLDHFKNQVDKSDNGLIIDNELEELHHCISNIKSIEKITPYYKLVITIDQHLDQVHKINNDDFNSLNNNKYIANIYRQMKKNIIDDAIYHFDSKEISEDKITEYYKSDKYKDLIQKWHEIHTQEKKNLQIFDQMKNYTREFIDQLHGIFKGLILNTNEEKFLAELYNELTSIINTKQSLHAKQIALEQATINFYWQIRKNQGSLESYIGNALEAFLNSKTGADLTGKYGPLGFVPNKIYGNPPILKEVIKNSSNIILQNDIDLIKNIKTMPFKNRTSKDDCIQFPEYLIKTGYYFNKDDETEFKKVFAGEVSPTSEQAARIRAVLYDLISSAEKRPDHKGKTWIRYYEQFYSPQIMRDNEIKHSYIIMYQKLKIKLGIEHLQTQRRIQGKVYQLAKIDGLKGTYDLTSVEGILSVMEDIRKTDGNDQEKLTIMGKALQIASQHTRNKAHKENLFKIFNRSKSNYANALDEFIKEENLVVNDYNKILKPFM